MQNHLALLNESIAPSRAFARIQAREIAATQDKEDLFLTTVTDPERPEPEIGIMG
jgi:hypothetical protein